ncbi:MAG: hypothetical protein AAF667_11330 [Pseudomonadota bacterium]
MADASHVSEKRLQVHWWAFLILLGPLAVFYFGDMLPTALGNSQLVFGEVALKSQVDALELAARMRYVAATLLYWAVAIGVLGLFLFDLLTRHGLYSRLMAAGAGVVAFAIFVLLSINRPPWVASYRTYELMGADLFDAVLAERRVDACTGSFPFRDGCDLEGAWFVLETLQGAMDLPNVASVIALILGMVLALSRFEGAPALTTPEGLRDEAGALAEAQLTVRRYLYCTGAMLTIGMAQLLAYIKWPHGLIEDSTAADAYGELVMSVALFRGIYFSVIILSFYLPTSLVLLKRIRDFNHALGKSDDAVTEPITEDFDLSHPGSAQALRSVLAIVSPILVGAVGSAWGMPLFN